MACRRWSPAKRSAVSSQTLTNLRLIDNVSDTLILRPLISHDKEHIIDTARGSARKISPAPCRNIAA